MKESKFIGTLIDPSCLDSSWLAETEEYPLFVVGRRLSEFNECDYKEST